MIDTREELLNALTEAAELEHGLLCQYLFTAFSMKKSPEEGVTWRQAEMIRRWEGAILLVARQEMAHLGTVSNLLTAVGGAPHFGRPNFPQPAPYYPDEVDFSLQRFSVPALDRFILFERPEPEAAPVPLAVAPEPVEYTRVGDLYRQIALAFDTLPLEDADLFLGPPQAQDDSDWSASLKLFRVTGRRSAIDAVRFIIEEGEGTDQDRTSSHYNQFLRVREEMLAEMGTEGSIEGHGTIDTPFDPARPVVDNPLTRPHRDTPGRGCVLTDPDTLEVAELFNAVYNTMMLMLMQFYAFASESPEQRAGLQASARQMMSAVVRPLGEVLTLLPAGPEYPGRTAGPGFEFYTDLRTPHSPRSSWTIIGERLSHEAAQCRRLSEKRGASPRLRLIHENLFLLARNMTSYQGLQELG
jgi:hypothetical protein